VGKSEGSQQQPLPEEQIVSETSKTSKTQVCSPAWGAMSSVKYSYDLSALNYVQLACCSVRCLLFWV